MEFIKSNLNLSLLRLREPVSAFWKKLNSNSFSKSLLDYSIYLLFLAVAGFGTPWILTKVLNTEYPVASITSGSMWPVLKTGDLIFIKGVETKKDVKEGDMVVYANGNGLTVHRLIKKNENSIVTKGDANNIEDQPVAYERIIGKVITLNNKAFKIPWLGNLSYFLRKGGN